MVMLDCPITMKLSPPREPNSAAVTISLVTREERIKLEDECFIGNGSLWCSLIDLVSEFVSAR